MTDKKTKLRLVADDADDADDEWEIPDIAEVRELFEATADYLDRLGDVESTSDRDFADYMTSLPYLFGVMLVTHGRTVLQMGGCDVEDLLDDVEGLRKHAYHLQAVRDRRKA